MDLATAFTKILAISTLIGNILTVLIIVLYFVRKEKFEQIMQMLSLNALRLGFILSILATFGSIAYSAVVGFPACILCWTQRIFMFPLSALFALALWRGDRAVLPYTLFLTTLGGSVATYNWVKDMLATYSGISLGCPVVPGLPSCDIINVLEFGYITIPMLALNAFIFIALVSYAGVRADKKALKDGVK